MEDSTTPLRIFIAMPGSTMGDAASWNDIPEIKRRLFQPIAKQIEQRTGRTTVLVIEKDKVSPGGIHRSMYREAVDADVYIADLTAANPNVYLELGVRWALKDGVTIPISQDVRDVRFNVSAARVIPYGPMPDDLERATRQIADAAVEGLTDTSRVDSPVRDSLSLVAIPQQDWDEIRAEVQRLKDERAEDLVADARAAPTPSQRMELLRRAVARNPANVQAHLELGIELRKADQYTDATEHLRRATDIDPHNQTAWRELGVALSKRGDLDQAVVALERAARLNDRDSETWSNLGGALRRLARENDGASFDSETLRRAKDAYDRAAELSGNDTYPLMNAARIGLLATANAPDMRADALRAFDELRLLTEFAVSRTKREDPWKFFDFADTLVLTGRVDDALEAAKHGIQLVAPENRASFLSSAIEPLDDLISASVLDDEFVEGIQRLISEYRAGLPAAIGS
jgi:Flp pilus assembly protein TadD